MAVDIRSSGLRIVAPDDDPVLDLEPIQGLWTEEQYLKLTDCSRRLIEFTNGSLEVQAMPTDKHQAISQSLFLALLAYVQPLGGRVLYAPLRILIGEGKFREPDIVLVRDAGDPRRQNRYWLGADLVVEIVSPDNPERDLNVKPVEYAEAGIPEYWIVNPMNETITVLTLAGSRYIAHGVFGRGQTADSVVLNGFATPVDALLDAK
jgi:Uma2 family endonuclease